jgi:hypothetical protein
LQGLHRYPSQGVCHGDNHLGRPKAEVPTGWRPRDQKNNRLARPAWCEAPAALAADQGSLC